MISSFLLSHIFWKETEITYSVVVGYSVILTFLSTTDSVRAKSNIQYLKSQKQFPGISYYFINYTTTNSSHTRIPPISYKHPVDQAFSKLKYGDTVSEQMRRKNLAIYTDLLMNFIFSMRFFLHETNAHWLWRGTDDTIVNLEKLDRLIIRLSAEYSESEEIFLGHCIDGAVYSEVGTYLQGGSGILMSRAAVKLLEPYITKEVELVYDPDDVMIGRVMKNIGARIVNSPYFMGHNIENIENIQNNTLDECPSLEDLESRDVAIQQCKHVMGPIRDVIFYHEQLGGDNVNLELQKNLKGVRQASQKVMWYTDQGGVVNVCKVL